MKYRMLFFLFLGQTVLSYSVKAQHGIPVIRAGSAKVAIKDGVEGVTRFWSHLEKSGNPVIYSLAKNQPARKVVFYTDLDSIMFTVQPESEYPVYVVMQKGDTCLAMFTTKNQIWSSKDMIGIVPFSLVEGKRIMIKASLNSHSAIDFMVDLGARYNYLIGKNIESDFGIRADGYIEDESVTGLATEQISSTVSIKSGNVFFAPAPLCLISEGTHPIGLIGSSAFQGSILELDFDHQKLLMHRSMPDYGKFYSKVPLRQTTGGLYIYLTIENGSKKSGGWFFIDTGADNELSLDARFVRKNGLIGTFRKTGEARISSPGGDSMTVSADRVEIPVVSVAGLSWTKVPAMLGKVSQAESDFEDGVIGIGLLKRCNLIFDFPGNALYLKHNQSYDEPFVKSKNNYFPYVLISAFLVLGIAYKLYYRLKERHKG